MVAVGLTAVGLLSTVHASSSAQSSGVDEASLALLQRWDEAVRGHEAGQLDEAVERTMALTRDDRRALSPAIRVFLVAMTGRGRAASNDLERRAAAFGHAARESPGVLPYLRRAAILHTDVAIAAARHPPSIVDLPVEPPGVDVSPLLATRSMTASKDGEIIGQVESDWNWPFARSLIDVFRTLAPSEPFPGDWFHATAAYMFAHGFYAEVSVHLEHATRLMPDDARVLFDRACYAEIQGLPMNQVLMRDVDPMLLRQRRQGGARPASATTAAARAAMTDAAKAALSLDIPFKEEANAEAERLFRRALKSDPALHEARVRLARLLVERKRYSEALAEAQPALEGDASPAVRFYGYLFAGRAEQALGRLDAAALNFAEAVKLFPTAQSALLAQSQVALMRADATGAIEPIQRLPAEPPDDLRQGDPWWSYRLASGRDWQVVYDRMKLLRVER
jgi:tetratricopeptide (TPR) repeat protein